MSITREDIEVGPSAVGQTVAVRRKFLIAITVVVAILLLCYSATARSIWDIWMRSDTYAHGVLILPISAWLIWEKRFELGSIGFKEAGLPLLLLAAFGFLWLVANLADVLVVQQYALVLIIIVSVWVILGAAAARILWFSLLFLLFAVPAGDGLVEPLMDFTTDFTVAMLKLTGIPVYREGNSFSIPSGDWSVIEACSGFRYLIASLTLGTLYAYLTYTKLWKRLAFIAVAILVPILANGLRAYFIVMVAHLSDMRLAVGIDHLVYGWVFFGIIIAVMFAVGGIWRDSEETLPRVTDSGQSGGDGRKIWIWSILAVSFGGVWPMLMLSIDDPTAQGTVIEISAPDGTSGWHVVDETARGWRPRMIGVDGEIIQRYKKAGEVVGLYLGVYRNQRQGAELVNSRNRIAGNDPTFWVDREKKKRTISVGEGRLRLRENLLERKSGEKLMVWSWYRIGTVDAANDVYAKLVGGYNKVTRAREDSALIAVATPYVENGEETNLRLTRFVDEMLASIEGALDEAAFP